MAKKKPVAPEAPPQPINATLSIESGVLKAALACAGKNDIRWYLNGVLLEIKGGRGFVVGTNGHIMFAHTFDAKELPDFQRILPRDLIEGTLPKGKTSVGVADQTITVQREGYGRVAPAINAKYPEWRAVIPTETNGEAAGFDPDYMAVLGKVARHIEGKYPVLRQNGKAAAVASFHGSSLFLIMPLHASPGELPTWHLPK